jgi:hypothetical protein
MALATYTVCVLVVASLVGVTYGTSRLQTVSYQACCVNTYSTYVVHCIYYSTSTCFVSISNSNANLFLNKCPHNNFKINYHIESFN